jgi:hypothetical protein
LLLFLHRLPGVNGNTVFEMAFYMFVVAPFMFMTGFYVSGTTWLLNI